MNDCILLEPGAIHLWLAHYEQIEDVQLHAAYRALLSDSEREQESRFHFARDRRRYLVTRALLRTVLSRYAPVAARDWAFTTNAYGRPLAAEAARAQLSFNISHTRGTIVLGVAKGRELGVDVENYRAREVSSELGRHFFTSSEAADLEAAPARLRQYRFFEYWTFKEAYIKARGMGLHMPLDKFSFQYPSERSVAITMDPELADDASDWQFWQCRPNADCLLAVCAERTTQPATEPILRQVVPMVHETRLFGEFTRVSESEYPFRP